MAVEVGDDAVEVIGDERAAGASGILLVDPEPEAEHEVVDEQLGAPFEELVQRLLPVGGLEDVLLLDRDPGELLASAGKFVPLPHVPLLSLKQLPSGRKPVFTSSCLVVNHRPSFGGHNSLACDR